MEIILKNFTLRPHTNKSSGEQKDTSMVFDVEIPVGKNRSIELRDFVYHRSGGDVRPSNARPQGRSSLGLIEIPGYWLEVMSKIIPLEGTENPDNPYPRITIPVEKFDPTYILPPPRAIVSQSGANPLLKFFSSPLPKPTTRRKK